MTLGRVYLAGAYARQGELRRYRDQLTGRGIEVVSRWLDQFEGDVLEQLTTEHLSSDPATCARYAQRDIEDVAASDTVISFTGGGGRGGRHVEFGYALEGPWQLILVGPREHIFHTLPKVWQFDTWEQFLAWEAVT